MLRKHLASVTRYNRDYGDCLQAPTRLEFNDIARLGALQGTGERRGPGNQSSRRIGLILTDNSDIAHNRGAADRGSAAETDSPGSRIRVENLHARLPRQPVTQIATDDGRGLAG